MITILSCLMIRLLRCVSRVNKIPPYFAILAITILSNGFNNNKKLVFFNLRLLPSPPNKNETLSSSSKVKR